jgi:TRAP-type C4-dicarboxylate transport system permease small subunit
MNSILRILTKLDNGLAKGEAALLIGLVSVMTVIVFLQVVYRYVLAQPLHWSEEMARYLFVWLSILGATLGIQKRGHFGLDILYRMLPDRGRRLLQFIIHLLMGTVILVILVQGIILVQKTIPQESPAMAISMGWAYACLPVGAGLMAIHLLVIFLKDWKDGILEGWNNGSVR